MNTSKQKWFSRTLFGFGLTSFFNDFNHEMITAVLPLVVVTITGAATAPLALGIISGLSLLARSFADLFGGWLAQRIKNQKLILVIGYSITPLFACLIGTAHSILLIIIYRVIAWAGRGMREPVRDAWLTAILNHQDYGKGFGFLRALDTGGAIIGPLIAYVALSRTSLNTIFWIALIPGILSILAITLLVKKYYAPAPKKSLRFIELWHQLPNRFKKFVAIRFLFGIGQFDSVLIILRAQEYITGQQTASIVAAGWAILCYTIFNIMRLISEFGIGALSDAYPHIRKKTLMAFFGFGTLALATILLTLETIPLWLWFFIFILAGLSLACVTVLEKTYSADLLPHDLLSVGYGILLMFIGISALLAGFIVGGLWSHFGPQIGFMYAAIISFIAMILLLIS